jgi:peroxisomal membrane protein 2
LDLWESYNEALVASPLFTKSITASIILGSADLAGQLLEKKKSYEAGGETVTEDDESEDSVSIASIDWARASRFAFFGLVLQAPWNHYYYLFLDGVLPPTEDPFTLTTAVKVRQDKLLRHEK